MLTFNPARNPGCSPRVQTDKILVGGTFEWLGGGGCASPGSRNYRTAER
jgi:hypothetical protein